MQCTECRVWLWVLGHLSCEKEGVELPDLVGRHSGDGHLLPRSGIRVCVSRHHLKVFPRKVLPNQLPFPD